LSKWLGKNSKRDRTRNRLAEDGKTGAGGSEWGAIVAGKFPLKVKEGRALIINRGLTPPKIFQNYCGYAHVTISAGKDEV